MQDVTSNVRTDTRLRGCNPSYVTTADGVVVVDTPQLPTKAIAMRREAESHGPIRYVINTEHHVDHIFGNYYFKGAGEVVHHQGVYDHFMVTGPDLDPFAYAAEAIPTDDPEGAEIFPERDEYFEDPNKGSIVFTGDLTLQVGAHTFHLLHTPGHTPGQVAVYVPQERVVFTGDTVFAECQTWLMESDVDQWLTALDTVPHLRAQDDTRAVIDGLALLLTSFPTAKAGIAPKVGTPETCSASSGERQRSSRCSSR
jgi:cyclase